MRNSVQIFLHHVENFFFSAAITVTVHKEVKEAVSKRDLTKKFILKKWTKKCETIPNTQSDFSPFFTNVALYWAKSSALGDVL